MITGIAFLLLLLSVPLFGGDLERLGERISTISGGLADATTRILESQGVRLIRGRGRFTGPNSAIAETEDGEISLQFDAALVSTGSKPRAPEWTGVDGERIITTRHAYNLPEVPEHMVVVGSGVTGVERVHIFESLGSTVSLLVSRQQVLPHRDPEVAAVLEDSFLQRGVRLLKGARATAITRDGDSVTVDADDGRRVVGSHVLLAVGRKPNTDDLGLEAAGVETDPRGYVTVDDQLRTSVPGVWAIGDVNERGAFTLRKSVEDVAEALGVSRFTVYNYLERIDSGP